MTKDMEHWTDFDEALDEFCNTELAKAEFLRILTEFVLMHKDSIYPDKEYLLSEDELYMETGKAYNSGWDDAQENAMLRIQNMEKP